MNLDLVQNTCAKICKKTDLNRIHKKGSRDCLGERGGDVSKNQHPYLCLACPLCIPTTICNSFFFFFHLFRSHPSSLMWDIFITQWLSLVGSGLSLFFSHLKPVSQTLILCMHSHSPTCHSPISRVKLGASFSLKSTQTGLTGPQYRILHRVPRERVKSDFGVFTVYTLSDFIIISQCFPNKIGIHNPMLVKFLVCV